MAELVRAFLALEIPDAIKAEVDASREPLKAELPRARWVRVDNQHLTLKFLGETPQPVLSALAAELGPRLAGVGGVEVRLAGSGFFPSSARPRVAWLGGTADGIVPVVEAIEGTAERHGFEPERRAWSLHVTQARLDRPWPRQAVERFLAWGDQLQPKPFVCPDVVLLSSRLGPGGSVYTPLARMPLT